VEKHSHLEQFMSLNTPYHRLFVLSAALAVIVMPRPVTAQLAPPPGLSYGGSVPNSKQVVSGIAWYGVLKDGLAEAKRTGKPIFFITAATQCQGVPGIW